MMIPFPQRGSGDLDPRRLEQFERYVAKLREIVQLLLAENDLLDVCEAREPRFARAYDEEKIENMKKLEIVQNEIFEVNNKIKAIKARIAQKTEAAG